MPLSETEATAMNLLELKRWLTHRDQRLPSAPKRKAYYVQRVLDYSRMFEESDDSGADAVPSAARTVRRRRATDFTGTKSRSSATRSRLSAQRSRVPLAELNGVSRVPLASPSRVVSSRSRRYSERLAKKQEIDSKKAESGKQKFNPLLSPARAKWVPKPSSKPTPESVKKARMRRSTIDTRITGGKQTPQGEITQKYPINDEPRSFTVRELKHWLTEYNVPFDLMNTHLKSYFVELVQKHSFVVAFVPATSGRKGKCGRRASDSSVAMAAPFTGAQAHAREYDSFSTSLGQTKARSSVSKSKKTKTQQPMGHLREAPLPQRLTKSPMTPEEVRKRRAAARVEDRFRTEERQRRSREARAIASSQLVSPSPAAVSDDGIESQAADATEEEMKQVTTESPTRGGPIGEVQRETSFLQTPRIVKHGVKKVSLSAKKDMRRAIRSMLDEEDSDSVMPFVYPSAVKQPMSSTDTVKKRSLGCSGGIGNGFDHQIAASRSQSASKAESSSTSTASVSGMLSSMAIHISPQKVYSGISSMFSPVKHSPVTDKQKAEDGVYSVPIHSRRRGASQTRDSAKKQRSAAEEMSGSSHMDADTATTAVSGGLLLDDSSEDVSQSQTSSASKGSGFLSGLFGFGSSMPAKKKTKKKTPPATSVCEVIPPCNPPPVSSEDSPFPKQTLEFESCSMKPMSGIYSRTGVCGASLSPKLRKSIGSGLRQKGQQRAAEERWRKARDASKAKQWLPPQSLLEKAHASRAGSSKHKHRRESTSPPPRDISPCASETPGFLKEARSPETRYGAVEKKVGRTLLTSTIVSLLVATFAVFVWFVVKNNAPLIVTSREFVLDNATPWLSQAQAFVSEVMAAATAFGTGDDTVFCDTGSNAEGFQCVPCPTHAEHCRNGRVDCRKGYLRQGRECVVDRATVRVAHEIDLSARRLLSIRLGAHRCGDDVEATMFENELYANLKVSEPKQLAESFAYFKRNLLPESRGIQFDAETKRYRSLKAIKPLTCQIKEWVLANFVLVTGAIVVISLIFYGITKYYIQSRNRSQAKALKKTVVEMLEDYCRQYPHAPHLPISQVRRQLSAVSEEVWDILRQDVDCDPTIMKSLRTVDGVSKLTWRTAGARFSSLTPSTSRPTSTGSLEQPKVRSVFSEMSRNPSLNDSKHSIYSPTRSFGITPFHVSKLKSKTLASTMPPVPESPVQKQEFPNSAPLFHDWKDAR